MPYKIKKLPGKEKYRVYGEDGTVKAKATTKAKAKAMIRLLNYIDAKKK